MSERGADDTGGWRPRRFAGSDPNSRGELDRLLAGTAVFRSHDTIEDQLGDLIASRHPAETLDRARLDALVRRHLAGTPPEQYGSWIQYPWSGRLVHLLPEPEFRELRTDRNRNKITADEQQRLAAARIGIVGLSVGQASAVTMALEGVGRRFRLADFDTLGLSNLNRLRAATHELGLNKAILAARQMFEIDPYLDIELFPDGITDATLDAFLGDGPGKLDGLVEECDDFYVKLRIREAARARGIPVVMDTNDRGLIDIERFDLEPDRPVFHGLVAGLDAEDPARPQPRREDPPPDAGRR